MKKLMLISFGLVAAIMLAAQFVPHAEAAVGDIVNWYWGRSPHWYGGLTIKYEGDEMYICENESATGYIFIMQPNPVNPNELDTVDSIHLGIAKDAGIAWDGDLNVWWVSGANWYFGIGRLPENGGTFNCSWITGHGVNPYGLDYYSPERELYIGSSVGQNVIVYDVSTGACPPPFDRYIPVGITPIAVSRAGDYLWVSDANDPFGTYKFDMDGNWMGDYFLLPEGRESLSLEFDGQYLWSRTNNNGNGIKIYQIDIDYATPTPVSPIIDSGDYNGDSTSDIAIFRASSGLWAIRDVTRAYFGASGDVPVPGDFDGDGSTDIGIFRASSGLWAVSGVTRSYFGAQGDTAVPGDYSGDGTCSAAIFRPSSGLWAIDGGGRDYFGGSSDIAVPVYGSGRANGKDIAIFRPSSGLWAIKGLTRVYFGASSDTPVAGNYTDTPDDLEIGVFRDSSGLWAIKGVTRTYFGASDDSPVPGNYTGFIPDDIGIFRASSGLWAIQDVTRVYFGTTGDIPVSGLAINPSTAQVI
ncbi:MAG: hypothetical protein U9N73_13650 [Candidatus Auribacterota bacterium]|nr:hypothetical protein [Candidatus Auribacterota bacterium]